jgi:uncharacterized protein YdhG (YjbR/CyaY superfamily)
MAINKPLNVNEYILQFPQETKKIMQEIRTLIKKIAPDSEENISYGMPAYKTNGKPLVYFAGYKNHIGFYATPNAHEKFKVELSEFKQGKGSVQFPLNQTMPYNLIIKIIKFKVEENKVNAKK